MVGVDCRMMVVGTLQPSPHGELCVDNTESVSAEAAGRMAEAV
jgi:hypothetical protein